MNDFFIEEVNHDGYKAFLIWLSTESLIDHISYIENSILTDSQKQSIRDGTETERICKSTV